MDIDGIHGTHIIHTAKAAGTDTIPHHRGGGEQIHIIITDRKTDIPTIIGTADITPDITNITVITVTSGTITIGKIMAVWAIRRGILTVMEIITACTIRTIGPTGMYWHPPYTR